MTPRDRAIGRLARVRGIGAHHLGGTGRTPRDRARRFTLALALAIGLAACGEQAAPTGPPGRIHGAVVLQPERIGVGELVTIDLTVVTPAGHQVRPVELPEAIAPLWLLDAERLPVRRDGERWVHTTRVRTRVREAPGNYRWPALTVEVEDPAGETIPLELEAVPFVVASASDAAPDRLEPFGFRMPAAARSAPSPASPLLFALAGAAATLLGLGVLRFASQRRAARKRVPPEDTVPAWTRAEQELRAALAGVASDPHAAADDAALCLRRYVRRRTGRAVESATTEEIAAQRPPGRFRSRWPEWVALLRRFDALRFPGHLTSEESREALRALIEEARAFVERSIPPRELR